jgi:hypothetical protein
MRTSTPSSAGLDTIVEPPDLPPRLPAREKKVHLKDKKEAEGSFAHKPQTPIKHPNNHPNLHPKPKKPYTQTPKNPEPKTKTQNQQPNHSL